MFAKLLVIAAAAAAAAAAAPPASKFKVKSLLNEKTLSSDTYTGYVGVNATANSNIFYTFFTAQNNASTAPLILWLTGGPGCSSELAMFQEQGPYSLNEDGTLKKNAFSWNTNAHLLYADQPVGTGYSYANGTDGFARSEEGVRVDAYRFLQGFISVFPEMAGRDFYVFGESYAGHYVPAISSWIVDQKKSLPATEALNLTLKGAAIGNGMTDPYIQYNSFSAFAYGHGMISETLKNSVDETYKTCATGIAQTGGVMSPTGETANLCNSIIQTISDAAGPFNVYDVRRTCPPTEPLCYNWNNMLKILNGKALRDALGVRPQSNWSLCNGDVYNAIIGDWFIPQDAAVKNLLENDVRVLVYNGAQGFICNFIGSERWVRALDWSGRAEYQEAKRTPWLVNGSIAGWITSSGALTMTVVNNAGHMSPMDQPENTLEMVRAFTAGGKF